MKENKLVDLSMNSCGIALSVPARSLITGSATYICPILKLLIFGTSLTRNGNGEYRLIIALGVDYNEN